MNDDGHTSSIRDKILTINVKPGWRSGTRITFPKEGDQGPNNIPGNCICFVCIFLMLLLFYFCCAFVVCFAPKNLKKFTRLSKY